MKRKDSCQFFSLSEIVNVEIISEYSFFSVSFHLSSEAHLKILQPNKFTVKVSKKKEKESCTITRKSVVPNIDNIDRYHRLVSIE